VLELQVTGPVRDEGTVFLLKGVDAQGDSWVFAADHRPAQAILEALEADEVVEVSIEDWQILGGPR
jgi:hypothetical protein